MSKSARRGVADRMLIEIHDYLATVLTSGIGTRDDSWIQSMAAPAEAMLTAAKEWEEGRLEYAELEAAGTQYVEAWMTVDAQLRDRGGRAA